MASWCRLLDVGAGCCCMDKGTWLLLSWTLLDQGRARGIGFGVSLSPRPWDSPPPPVATRATEGQGRRGQVSSPCALSWPRRDVYKGAGASDCVWFSAGSCGAPPTPPPPGAMEPPRRFANKNRKEKIASYLESTRPRSAGFAPPPSRAPSLCPATVSLIATASFNGVCNRQ